MKITITQPNPTTYSAELVAFNYVATGKGSTLKQAIINAHAEWLNKSRNKYK